jgi:hypothetical protein
VSVIVFMSSVGHVAGNPLALLVPVLVLELAYQYGQSELIEWASQIQCKPTVVLDTVVTKTAATARSPG